MSDNIGYFVTTVVNFAVAVNVVCCYNGN